jgi:hypothetical protein
MLERWVAKRGLLFKERIVCTDAMVNAAQHEAGVCVLSPELIRKMIEKAIAAREPHAASNTVQNRTAKKR